MGIGERILSVYFNDTSGELDSIFRSTSTNVSRTVAVGSGI